GAHRRNAGHLSSPRFHQYLSLLVVFLGRSQGHLRMPGDCEGMDDPRTAYPDNDTQDRDQSQTDGAPSGASGWISAAAVGAAPAPGVTGGTGARGQPTTPA